MRSRFPLIVAIAFILLFCPSIVAASTKGEIQLGFKAGGRLSTFTGTDTWSSGMRRTFSAGFFGNYSLGSQISIQLEINYAAKGSIEDVLVGNTLLKGKIKVDYIEIPVLFRLAYSRQSSVVPRIFLGPAIGILIKEEGVVKYEGRDLAWVLQNTRSLDLGIAFGLGLDIATRHGIITFDFRVTPALSTLHEDYPEFDRKNISLALQVGFAIVR